MAHAHQRTLLAKMGFGDPDLKLPEHDAACQYLTSKEIFPKVFAGVIAPKPIKLTEYGIYLIEELSGYRVEPEFMLTKGDGQYKTTIGFVDAKVTFRAKAYAWEHPYKWGDEQVEGRWRPFSGHLGKPEADFTMGIEVKIRPETIASCLRQIAVYREFGGGSWIWLLATKFPISTGDAEELAQSKVLHLRLGAGFQEHFDKLNDPRTTDVQADSVEL